MIKRLANVFVPGQPLTRKLSFIDLFIIVAIIVALGVLVETAIYAPSVYRGPKVSLSPKMLPFYAVLSITRMFLAYVLSIIFTLIYGRAAATTKIGQRLLLPILDILQSVPLLSFLPLVLLSLSVLLPQTLALEISSIILIFTSQAWNLTFSWYQSLTTLPSDLKDTSAMFGFTTRQRFLHLEMSFAAVGLIWNSIMSWAGGWFFLMAAEMFTVGDKDFRLPGLGSYLREAASSNNYQALVWGLFTVILIIVLLDQLIWRPLLTWADKFKLSMIEEDPLNSWFLRMLQGSTILRVILNKCRKIYDRFSDKFLLRERGETKWAIEQVKVSSVVSLFWKVLVVLLVAVILWGLARAYILLAMVKLQVWIKLLMGLLCSFLRVFLALVLALMWTLPVGILIGTNRKWAAWLQPIVQIAASVPATALFPVLLVFVLNFPMGTDIAAVLLMMMGTQWYLLFNIIAGASTIPQDMKYQSRLLQLGKWKNFRSLTLPALGPYIITGAITASGGAWNASIVAEYTEFGGKTLSTKGIGAMIAQATAMGDYPELLSATLMLVLCVISINRFVWRRLYEHCEQRYHIE
ncbi:MAG: ABC transporter permease subunit [Deltaproteobacteria bacterium]|nr:ABC transporter permease subunit [Deltaproteobacteria bacterium]